MVRSFKKLVSLVLVLALSLAISLPAFAATTKSKNLNTTSRNTFQQVRKAIKTSHNTPKSSGILKPNSITEDIQQSWYVKHNTTIILEATVSSGTGASGSFVYDTTSVYESYPDNAEHIEVTDEEDSISSNGKSCAVTITGYVVSATGQRGNTVIAKHIFNAG